VRCDSNAWGRVLFAGQDLDSCGACLTGDRSAVNALVDGFRKFAPDRSRPGAARSAVRSAPTRYCAPRPVFFRPGEVLTLVGLGCSGHGSEPKPLHVIFS